MDETTKALRAGPTMPTFFFGHGNPMNAIQHNAYTDAWAAIGRALPRPRAILVVSAHWYRPGTWVTAMRAPRTIHDFGGFPRELFEVVYPAPGDPALAREVQEMLAPVPVGLDEEEWGLDHGTWSVLCHVFPDASVPVLQLGIDETQPSRFHYDLGHRLTSLRDRRRPQWQTWVPLGLVVLSLLALAILPGAVARRTARLQSEIAERVTPVRNDLHAFGLAFAREVLAFRAWALTGDTGFAEEFKRSAEDADRSLDAAARNLSGTDLAPLAAELRSTLGGWREMVRQIMESRIGRADPLADLSNQERRVNAVLELSTRLDRRLRRWEEATPRLKQSESRRQGPVSLFLAMVALTATVAVAMLSVQSRRQARQLRYRAQEERALRDVARTLSAAVTVNEVAQRVVQAAVETTRGFGAYVEEARVQDVEVVAAVGQGGPPVGTRAPFPGSLTDAALHSGEATVVMEIGAMGEAMAPYLQGCCQRCTGLVVPLMGGTEVLGALVILRSSAQEAFGPNEVRHPQALGDLVSSALRRVTPLDRPRACRKATPPFPQ